MSKEIPSRQDKIERSSLVKHEVVGYRLLVTPEFQSKLSFLSEDSGAIVDYRHSGSDLYKNLNKFTVSEREDFWEKSTIEKNEQYGYWKEQTVSAIQGTTFITGDSSKKEFYQKLGTTISNNSGGHVDFLDFTGESADTLYDWYFSEGSSNVYKFVYDVLSVYTATSFSTENVAKFKESMPHVKRLAGMFGGQSAEIITCLSSAIVMYESDRDVFFERLQTLQTDQTDVALLKQLLGDSVAIGTDKQSEQRVQPPVLSQTEPEISAEDSFSQRQDLSPGEADGHSAAQQEDWESPRSQRQSMLQENELGVWGYVQEKAPIVWDTMSATARTVFEKSKDGYTLAKPKISKALRRGMGDVTYFAKKSKTRVEKSWLKGSEEASSEEETAVYNTESSDQVLSELPRDDTTETNGEVTEKGRKRRPLRITRKESMLSKVEAIADRILSGDTYINVERDENTEVAEEIAALLPGLNARGVYLTDYRPKLNTRFASDKRYWKLEFIGYERTNFESYREDLEYHYISD